MSNLDDPQAYKRLDPTNMLEHLHDLPQQCRTAWRKAKDFNLPQDYATIDKVVVLGMGGSAIGGSLLRNFVSRLTKPVIFVTRDYDPPAFIDDKTLVIASSYSGNTEETLTAFSQTLEGKCKKLAITTGGKLKALAQNA
jgi:glucose/mannose-6-phosphate isomerase